ncbi:TolB family protein [bacterium]|nr:TolB family protein [bacterium]
MNHVIFSAAVMMMTVMFVSCAGPAGPGIFSGSGDIGDTALPGRVVYDDDWDTYTITASGDNMWAGRDDLHFVWKKMSGDLALAADIEWIGEGTDPHRKACLIIRQSLDPGSVCCYAALHGDGLTCLQYREFRGGDTREIRISAALPRRVTIEKRGAYYSLLFDSEDSGGVPAGGSCRLDLEEPFYVGLGVCAHTNSTLETAMFSRVAVRQLEPVPDSLTTLESTLETISIASLNRRVVCHTDGRLEAPNWSPDGTTLIFNSDGLLYRISAGGGRPERIPTGFAGRINNDHGISPDGRQLVISDQSETGSSLIYTLPFAGGIPKRITPLGPSYWHGWSPDGKRLAYCAERNGNYDIYTIPVTGGTETRLTTAEGLDDGPDYSPDGNYIYFNSARSGTMQIWRMRPDGSGQTQITEDDDNDWFPHPSPDGKWLVYVSFAKDVPAGDHPPDRDVMLRLLNLETREVTVLARLLGGQGTINVPSWAPDSRELAFVSYQRR